MEPDQIVRAANEARAIGGSRLGELDLMETLVDYPGAACTIVRCRTMRAQVSATVIVKRWNADQDAMRTEWIALKYLGGLSSTIPLAPAREANELTNYVLLVQDVKATKPTGDMFRYLSEVPHSRLVDAAIPTDPALWEPSRFRDFIKERRRLLAAHMNEALKALAGTTAADPDASQELAIEVRNDAGNNAATGATEH